MLGIARRMLLNLAIMNIAFQFAAGLQPSVTMVLPDSMDSWMNPCSVARLVSGMCRIHEHMRVRVRVLETPHFTTTKTDGTYRLTGLPAGRSKLKAWVSSTRTLEHVVDVKAGTAHKVQFP